MKIPQEGVSQGREGGGSIGPGGCPQGIGGGGNFFFSGPEFPPSSVIYREEVHIEVPKIDHQVLSRGCLGGEGRVCSMTPVPAAGPPNRGNAVLLITDGLQIYRYGHCVVSSVNRTEAAIQSFPNYDYYEDNDSDLARLREELRAGKST